MNKQPRGLATTRKVLSAALECFVASGAQGLTIQALAERSGVSVGSIYHHFGSRERVFFQLYCQCLEAMLSFITSRVVRRRTAREGVRALVTAYLDFASRHRDEVTLIFAASHTELIGEHRPELAALAERVTRPIAEWLAPHIAAGTIVPLPPALYEVVLIGPASEAARRILTGAPGLTFAAARATLPDRVWAAVSAEESRFTAK